MKSSQVWTRTITVSRLGNGWNGFAPQVDGAILYPAWTVVHAEREIAPGGPPAVHAKRESTCFPVVILSRVAAKNLPQFHETPRLRSG
ncbi:MAG: hypothetical protein H5T68_04010 [Chloroflexi bacterium]|nr:hypothetical protein [Chloroflexota bacterium]